MGIENDTNQVVIQFAKVIPRVKKALEFEDYHNRFKSAVAMFVENNPDINSKPILDQIDKFDQELEVLKDAHAILESTHVILEAMLRNMRDALNG